MFQWGGNVKNTFAWDKCSNICPDFSRSVFVLSDCRLCVAGLWLRPFEIQQHYWMWEAQQRPEQIQRLHVSVSEFCFQFTVNWCNHMSHIKLLPHYWEAASSLTITKLTDSILIQYSTEGKFFTNAFVCFCSILNLPGCVSRLWWDIMCLLGNTPDLSGLPSHGFPCWISCVKQNVRNGRSDSADTHPRMILTFISLLWRRPDAAGILLPGYRASTGMVYCIIANGDQSDVTSLPAQKAIGISEHY